VKKDKQRREERMLAEAKSDNEDTGIRVLREWSHLVPYSPFVSDINRQGKGTAFWLLIAIV